MDKWDKIFDAVEKELFIATEKFGAFNSPHEGYAILQEEVEELWDEIKANKGRTESARKEAVQVAAMAIRYLYDMDPK